MADALEGEGWRWDRSRSRSHIISLLKERLPNAQEIIASEEEDDKYVWYPQQNRGTGQFSAGDTWRALHPISEVVFWHKVVWFSGRIPKHAFITWVAARDRMVTRDRLLRWGLVVPATCVLCSGHNESRQHLFFDCSFSTRVWTFFTSQLHLSPPQGFENVLRWLLNPSRDKNVTLIARLVFQAVVYLVWKERNSRIHSSVEKPAGTVIAEIQQLIKLRLDPLARRQLLHPGQSSVLAIWLSSF